MSAQKQQQQQRPQRADFTTQLHLSAHDQQVLTSIFSPLELTSTLNAATINPDANAELVDIEKDTEQVQKSKALELTAIHLTENGKLSDALEIFEQAVAVAPERASVYNNRAQALRLAGKDEAAFKDLNKAIDLATQNEQAKTKCHALCQRGVLFRKWDNLEAARADFEQAAKLGSNFARQQLVEINPYAALCNQMLRQAFSQLK